MNTVSQTLTDKAHAAPDDAESEALGRARFRREFGTCLDYLPAREMDDVYRAYRLSEEAHLGQLRLSGEPYISHPVEVAKVLAGFNLDAATVTAGLLHDVLEDTHVAKHDVARRFGREVAEIVDGVSKVEQLESGHRKITQAESFRKMLLATARDLRVILVKLADRLHNMRTLQYKSSAKRRVTARETLEVYVPMAQQLGIGKVWSELEMLGFKALHPWRHRILSGVLEKNEDRHKRVMDGVFQSIEESLSKAGIAHALTKRKKNPYSVYRKMREKKRSFAEVLDILAIRIVVGSVDECYRVLGRVHNLYRPQPGVFRDYIALPKPNGYQSLHTVLFGPGGIPVEVQIRTRDMNDIAEGGIASHAGYKSAGAVSPAAVADCKAKEWIESLVEMHGGAGASEELLEDFKVSQKAKSVYVFTPDAEIITLPLGATVLDFAFAVHTDIGLRCRSARIGEQICPPSQVLRTGQTVRVNVSGTPCPTPQWLDFAVTVKARSAVRHHLKRVRGDAAVGLGRDLFGEMLRDCGSSLDRIDAARLQRLVEDAGFRSADELFCDIGMGNQMPALLARRLLGRDFPEARGGSRQRLEIKGTEGVAVDYSKCCHPIPGDSIIGLMSPGRGLTVHRNECSNVQNSKRRGQCFFLEWSNTRPKNREYLTAVRAVMQHRRGMLAVIAAQIAQMDSNIEHISFDNYTGSVASLTLIITVRDRTHLAKIMRRIHNASRDIRIARIS